LAMARGVVPQCSLSFLFTPVLQVVCLEFVSADYIPWSSHYRRDLYLF
jgi:hypothetical protein